MTQPDMRTARLLLEMAEAASRGEIHDVFIVYRGVDPFDYGCTYRTSDLDDMAFQVRTELLNLRATGGEHNGGVTQ